MLYIGETGRTLEDRIREHVYYINRQVNQPTGLHFSLPSHSISNFRVQVLWGVRGDTIDRKLWEHLWIERLGTKTPLGMNRKE